ncbi:hypothetical protein SUDANB171_03506 [Streptomyces sp. enrichment culture]|uniref:DUF7144 family membrane protein n=1 Tax=Streptomyces sp. enrichment culture TaxID=1795815 RepID=UPI003F54B379
MEPSPHSTGPAGGGPGGRSPGPAEARSLWADGLVLFAAIMLVIGGIMDILRGSMALAKDQIFITTPDYALQLSLTRWGWIHLVLGILAVLVGLGLFRAALWARVAGVVIAGLLMLAAFLTIPYYPLWSVVLIALYAFVIWALCAVRPPRPE